MPDNKDDDERYALTEMPEANLRETLEHLYLYFDPEWIGSMAEINYKYPFVISLAIHELERSGRLKDE